MKTANKFQFLVLCLVGVMLLSPASAQMVTFKTLDKVTAKISHLETEVGRPTVLGPLTITVRTCKTTPPEEPPETSVYLEIDERASPRWGHRTPVLWLDVCVQPWAKWVGASGL